MVPASMTDGMAKIENGPDAGKIDRKAGEINTEFVPAGQARIKCLTLRTLI
jgi:hypothetical protein